MIFIKIYVRTTGERDLSSYSFLDYIPLIDTKHQPVPSFIEQMRIISSDDALFIEDDVVFCKNFLEEVEKAINKYPNQIINFFYQPLAYFPTTKVAGKRFLWNQCVYYPKGIALTIADKMQELINNGIKWTQYDEIEGAALDALGIDFITYRPFLVQHVGKVSLLGNDWLNHGRTVFFKDDLDAARIDYRNAKITLDYGYDKLEELGVKFTRPVVIYK